MSVVHLRLPKTSDGSSRTDRSLERFKNKFLNDRIARSHTKSAVKHLEGSFKKLFTYLDEHEKQIINIDHLDNEVIRGFIAHLLRKENLAAYTVRGYVSDLKTWTTWLIADGDIAEEKNPFKNVKLPKVPKTIPDHFSHKEWLALEKATSGKDPLSVRNRALIYVLLDTGFRLNELASIKIRNLDLEGREIRLMGKGQKEGVGHLSAKAVQALSKYLAVLSQGDRLDENQSLWIGRRGPVGYSGLENIVQKLGKRATYEHNGRVHRVAASPHKFRRTCAINLLRDGASVMVVKNIMRHEDIQVLQKYVAFLEADVSQAYKAHNPQNGWRKD